MEAPTYTHAQGGAANPELPNIRPLFLAKRVEGERAVSSLLRQADREDGNWWLELLLAPPPATPLPPPWNAFPPHPERPHHW